MAFFQKEKEVPLTPKQFSEKVRQLEEQIRLDSKMLDLEMKQEKLSSIRSAIQEKKRKNSKFGKFFSTLGELGGNMNSNLDKEHREKGSGLNLNHQGLTAGLPGIASETGKKGGRGVAATPDFGYTGLTDGLPGVASKGVKKRTRA